jgi:lysophospholipid acyltransferase (LPLAT)-like uncharacterized protein
MSIRKIRQDFLRFLGNYFLKFGINALCKSINVKIENENAVKTMKEQNKNYILAFWHGTMLLPWYLHGDPSFVALTSKSKDGDLLAKILKSWNYRVVRGSSSTGGDVALGIMVDYARNNYSIAITPDGPRGPKNKFKAGAVITAKKSSKPLILAGVGFRKKKILSNWDNFEIPYFFTTAKIIYSDPIFVNSGISYEETSALIKNCEETLNRLQEKAQGFS